MILSVLDAALTFAGINHGLAFPESRGFIGVAILHRCWLRVGHARCGRATQHGRTYVDDAPRLLIGIDQAVAATQRRLIARIGWRRLVVSVERRADANSQRRQRNASQ